MCVEAHAAIVTSFSPPPLTRALCWQALPAPESLMGKVVVKGKTLTKVVNPQPVPLRFLHDELTASRPASVHRATSRTGSPRSASALSRPITEPVGMACSPRSAQKHAKDDVGLARMRLDRAHRRKSTPDIMGACVRACVCVRVCVLSVRAHSYRTHPGVRHQRHQRRLTCCFLIACHLLRFCVVLLLSGWSALQPWQAPQRLWHALRHESLWHLSLPRRSHVGYVPCAGRGVPSRASHATSFLVVVQAIKFPGFTESKSNPATIMSSFRVRTLCLRVLLLLLLCCGAVCGCIIVPCV